MINLIVNHKGNAIIENGNARVESPRAQPRIPLSVIDDLKPLSIITSS